MREFALQPMGDFLLVLDLKHTKDQNVCMHCPEQNVQSHKSKVN